MKFEIRELRPPEYPLLEEFLYQAIFVAEGEEPPEREIVKKPELQVYIEGFGERPDDHALLGLAGGKPAGLCWVRVMDDYGHVDDETPSFAISLLPEYRGQGLGSALLGAMLDRLRQLGYRQASLAVQKRNYAVRMYQKAGFRTVDENEEEFIMVNRLE